MAYRILAVDDDDVFRYTIVKLLVGAGYETEEAADYRNALAVLENEAVQLDMLLTDIVLPVVNGFALARMARMRRTAIHLIYTTGNDVPVFEAAGPVLRKPIDGDALLAAIQRVRVSAV